MNTWLECCIIGSVLTLGACKTVPKAPATKSLSALLSGAVNSGFVDLEGETGKYSPTNGLICPSQLNGMDFKNAVEFDTKGQSASCTYQSDSKGTLNLYYSDAQGEAFTPSYQGMVYSAALVGAQSGFMLDGEASTACTLAGLIVAAAEKTEGVFSYEAAVLKNDKAASVAALHPIDDKLLKIRYTMLAGDTSVNEVGINMCFEAGRVMAEQSKLLRTRKVKCSPTYTQVYQPPLKLGGAGRVRQVPNGTACRLSE